MEENLMLLPVDELPQTDEAKKKPQVNCMQEILAELMSERGITDAQVVKATGIPWGTWSAWVSGDVRAQLADKNLLKVARFFNIDLFYLLYGIGTDEPYFLGEEEEKED